MADRGRSQGRGGRGGGEPPGGPPTNSLCFAVRASGHQHRGQVRSLPLQSMQEQRLVQPGPGGAAPLRLPPWLPGTRATPTFQLLGALRPADHPPPRTVDKSTLQLTPSSICQQTPELVGPSQWYHSHANHRGPHIVFFSFFSFFGFFSPKFKLFILYWGIAS